MKKYVIKLNGKVYEVEMGEAGAVAQTATPAAAPVSAAPAAAPAPVAPAAPIAGGGEAVIAPMPGNILNVLVKPGDVVKKNQVLLVLEAMKMENEIVAPKDGTVVSVTASRGVAVNVSEELVRIG